MMYSLSKKRLSKIQLQGLKKGKKRVKMKNIIFWSFFWNIVYIFGKYK